MFGDYEAQRHWMEVTTQLPVSQWYFHDLQWWGLDYPPLTAYHSWLLGKIGASINPSWFALYASRGSSDPALKVFMRATVIVSEYLVYIPAVVVFVRRYSRLNGVATWTASVALVAILMQPATMLIDHIHFQYNTVMLGLVLASMSSMLAERYFWASVFFVAALGFKQMALYYAFSVFAYLLGNCVFPRINALRFLGIAAVTLGSFAILALPIVAGTVYDSYRGIDSGAELDSPPPPLPLFPGLADYLDAEAFYYPVVAQMAQVVHRIFPFARGLFEDKVANFWCAANLVIKLRQYPPELLQKAALLATLAATAYPNLILFFRPRKTLLPLAFAATAWGFFLFSYQVHEKSVLLPLMPMTVMLAGSNGLGKDTRAWVGFANMLGVWTLFPLLERVDLRMPYAVLTLLWAYLLGLPPTSLSAYFQDGTSAFHQWGTVFLHGAFYLAMAMWHVLELYVSPPPDKPDLWVVANVGVGGRRLLHVLPVVHVAAHRRERGHTEIVAGKPKNEGQDPVTAGQGWAGQVAVGAMRCFRCGAIIIPFPRDGGRYQDTLSACLRPGVFLPQPCFSLANVCVWRISCVLSFGGREMASTAVDAEQVQWEIRLVDGPKWKRSALPAGCYCVHTTPTAKPHSHMHGGRAGLPAAEGRWVGEGVASSSECNVRPANTYAAVQRRHSFPLPSYAQGGRRSREVLLHRSNDQSSQPRASSRAVTSVSGEQRLHSTNLPTQSCSPPSPVAGKACSPGLLRAGCGRLR